MSKSHEVTHTTIRWGYAIYITGRITSRASLCSVEITWTETVRLGQLDQGGNYVVYVNIQDEEFSGRYSCRKQITFVVQPVPPYYPWPPYPWLPTPRPDYTAQLQAMFNRLSKYTSIAKQANAQLSSEEKQILATTIMPILAWG